MSEGVQQIHEKIRSFQRKYYLNIFIRGVILTLSILIGYFLLASMLEHTLWLSPWLRFAIVLLFVGVAVFSGYRYLNQPFKWWLAKKGLTDEDAARLIGSSLPGINDRLVNLIQLERTIDNSGLAYASIQQKTLEFQPLSFEEVVNLKENRKYLKYLAIPAGIIAIILFINQNVILKSTDRIVHFNREYSPEAPFTFNITNKNLTAFYNEDFAIAVELDGQAIPPSAYMVVKNQRFKLENLGNGKFQYVVQRIQQKMDFQIEAAGFFSKVYSIEIVSRPEVTQFNVELEFPRYIGRKNEKIVNAGNIEVPEGTLVRWKMTAANADKAAINFASIGPQNFSGPDNQLFQFSKKFTDPDQYEINLENDKSKNKERIAYRVDVVKDEFPQIVVNNFKDSILYQRVILGGAIADDYGLTQLSLNFKVKNDDQKEILNRSIKIPVAKNQQQQSFFYNWSVDSLDLKPGDQLEYYLQVWDNDGVNGRKSTRSANYTFLVPTEENLVADISRSQSQTQSQIDKSVDKATKLQDQIEQANQKLKGKQTLDWQDKKMLEDLIQQKQGLDQMVEDLKDQNKLLEDKKDAFTEQDERIKEKAAQIKKLMDELLDEETKKLFEELKKLLNENVDVSQIQKLLDKLNQNTNNLEKELERTLELFKQLQYDFKLDQTVQDLKKLVAEQKELLEKTESLEKDQNKNHKDNKDQGKNSKDNKDQKEGKENSGKKNEQSEGDKENKNGDEKSGDKNDPENGSEKRDSQELAKEQEEIKEDFKKTSEKIDELEKLGEELDKNDELPGDEESQEVEEQQEQSQEMLQQNSPSKSKQPQQKALDKMQKMQEKMEGMQNSMMMEMDMQNLESLRQILHGLVKLSFDQESLMKEFNDLAQNDPRFNNLAQQELKLKDDAKVLEDSLLALGKKDPMMGSFITKEIGELNDHMEKVIESNRERRRPQASSEMQMTMTSINNLALMLDDHFDMMMQMMANAQPSMKKSNQKKGQKPSLSQMQQQLNQKIQQLKGSGKSGRELSEELAEMAAEQERIRRALQEMQEKMKNEGQMPGGDLPSKMEQTEMDLVNKQLTDQLIQRQKEIMTRLLETEKSMREQDMDDERKGETAKDYEKEIPKAFEDYLRLKEKEVELLKTIPPKLYPYYKREVSEYFKRMGENE
jgi:hypothetical protein